MGSNKGRNNKPTFNEPPRWTGEGSLTKDFMPARRTRLIVQALQYANVMDIDELTKWAEVRAKTTMKVYIDMEDSEKVSEGIKIMEEFKNEKPTN